MESIKLLDFFGVFFQFRMENYKTFTSKTGGINFIIYIVTCVIISFSYIQEFLDSEDSKNYVNSHREILAFNETINLIDENFTFAIKYPDVQLEKNGPYIKDLFNISVVYRTSEYFNKKSDGRIYNIENIPKKNCSDSDFYTNKLANYTLENMECFNSQKNQTIRGYYYSKNYNFFQILVRLNLSKIGNYSKVEQLYKENKIWINVLYPTNIVENYEKVTKIISDLYYLFSLDTLISSNIYIKKETYIQDDGILFNNTKKIVTAEYEKQDTFLSYENFLEPNSQSNVRESVLIGKFYFRQFFTSAVRERKRMKLLSLVSKINNLFINIFIIFRIFMSVVNLKKAKKHILENIFYINTQNESDSKKIDDYKVKPNSTFNDSKSFSSKRMDDKRSFFIDNEKIKQKLFANQESIFHEYNKKQMDELDNSEERLESEVEVQLDDLKSKYDGELDINNDNINDHNNKENLRERKESFCENVNKNIKEENFQDLINISVVNDLTNKMLNKNAEEVDKKPIDNNLNSKQNDVNKMNQNASPNRFRKKLTMMSSIKEKFSKENKLNRKINLRSIIKMCICCKFQRLKKINKIYSFAEEKFDDFVNIKNYIKKMQEMESLKRILFNDDGQTLFDFISRPRFATLFDENDEIITYKKNYIPKLSCVSYQKNLYGKFLSINNKTSITDIEKKLMKVFIEELN